MKESTHVNALISKNVPAMWTRVENSVMPGPGDLQGIKFGRDVWIESKLFNGNKIHVRAAQNAWMTNRAAHGGRAFIAARKLDDLLHFDAGKLPALIAAGVVVIVTASEDSEAPVKAGRGVRIHPQLPYQMANAVFRKPYDWPKMTRFLFGDSPCLKTTT